MRLGIFSSFSSPAPQLVGSPQLTNAAEEGAEQSHLERVAAGDRDALRRVYREHNVAVRAFAGRLLGDEDSVEDLVQEVFMALPRALAKYRQEASLRSYLLGMAANCARKHVRTAARRRKHLSNSQEVHKPLRTPEEDLHCARLVARLMTALDAMPVELRVAFVFCQVEERDASEVAAILGVPPSTVRSRLAAARARLQQTSLIAREEVT
jgi:RNA polymerase sigma-70 factor, ECF subfamily